ncbi:hypothetical protein CL52_12560 [Stutzerimonas balearica DSM 6083]|uniref:Uncharacterized protein n=1 Tax=Stutzerimonas balearica DSM 6083 TaxID=1123016 RepID=A0A8D3Y205_9GAMM|nr:hypothetical protein CL52_12560 [Stutzerimonas balearica DSM 6083]
MPSFDAVVRPWPDRRLGYRRLPPGLSGRVRLRHRPWHYARRYASSALRSGESCVRHRAAAAGCQRLSRARPPESARNTRTCTHPLPVRFFPHSNVSAEIRPSPAARSVAGVVFCDNAWRTLHKALP